MSSLLVGERIPDEKVLDDCHSPLQEQYKLSDFEWVFVPTAVFWKAIPWDVFIDRFPEVMERMVNEDVRTPYVKDDFSLERYLFKMTGSGEYFVTEGRFPFREEKDFIGLAKSVYFVFSEKLERMHCFLEVLRLGETMEGPEYYYEIIYVTPQEDTLMYYISSTQGARLSRYTAEDCVGYAYDIEKHGFVGDNGWNILSQEQLNGLVFHS